MVWLGLMLLAGIAEARSTRLADAPGWVVDLWGTDDGLPLDHVTSVARSGDGRIWAGTFDGVVQFDGVAVVADRRATHPCLPSNRMPLVAADPSGLLWAVSETGVAMYRDAHAWSPAQHPDGMTADSPFGYPGRVLRAGDDVWIAQPGRLLPIDGASSRWVATGDAASPTGVAPDPRGGRWFSVANDLLRHQAPGEARLDVDPSRLWVTALTADALGAVWALADGDLLRWGGDDWMTVPLPVEDACVMAEVGDGVVVGGRAGWAKATSSGVLALPWDATAPCGDLAATGVVRSFDGVVWIGGPEGLYRDGERLVRGGPPIADIVSDGSDGVWFGTTGAGLGRIRRALVEARALDEGNVHGVVVGAAGEVWSAPSQDAPHLLRLRG
ncbi:MAG TPA: hypothetical protein PKA64_06890, partial [Myxococcota bacterium]|nr:hypothetical protein [Myxococcota bacterium]